ncbi:DUF3027 domain-containing protein [Amnibacterium flavum]|uniref:DUF3027 domain-containing protein n=1 Tax=Amnibacterium flavum TaxID=2173173 RepID=A0A2V1HP12_9MICO|nr:DUF3027 domain-containing protein [Amnibacterium flavum]PVZ93342.1 DUF3027 domain-containing protein [Amnibacterium flavum]
MREPQDADRGLIDRARVALFEITDAETVGPVVGLDDETEGVVNVLFASTMPGYPNWRWNVAVSVIDGVESPSVLEAELLPGEGALLAPDWVPWADRLADYRAAQGENEEESEDEVAEFGDDDLDDDDDDEEDLDDDDEPDELVRPDSDIDGVDFEAVDPDEAADEEIDLDSDDDEYGTDITEPASDER